MRWIFSALTIVFSSLPAYALLAFEVAPQDVERIVVVGLDAQVQMVGQANAAKLRVSGIDDTSEPGNFALERKDRVLFIKMQEFSDKKEWKEALTKPHKKKVLEFTGASVPVEIQLREGSVSSQKWSKELKISLVKGKVVSNGGSASLSIQLQNGDVTVVDQTSKLAADVYKGQLTVKNLQGDLDGSVFSGSMNIEKSKGVLSVTTTQATAKVVQSSGTLQFENVKGSLVAQQFAGRVDGQTGEGSVSLSILSDTDVHVKSNTGRVSVQTTPGSGAFLNLLTTDGEITVPGELRVNRSATEKSVKGRLKGGEQKGSIVVRSQEGNILVK
ncbi:hypothetical protein [Bdellovibrio sp. HCB337]|uniref:hypothetical protein n=1 Tax=Bdellovibrio sp. HCB337 TaxID=3394358 RepID=UPI0039A52085